VHIEKGAGFAAWRKGKSQDLPKGLELIGNGRSGVATPGARHERAETRSSPSGLRFPYLLGY